MLGSVPRSKRRSQFLRTGGRLPRAAGSLGVLQNAMSALDQLLSELTRSKKKAAGSYCDAIVGHLTDAGIETTAFTGLFDDHRLANDYNTEVMDNQAPIAAEAEKLKDVIRNKIVGSSAIAERIRHYASLVQR